MIVCDFRDMNAKKARIDETAAFLIKFAVEYRINVRKYIRWAKCEEDPESRKFWIKKARLNLNKFNDYLAEMYKDYKPEIKKEVDYYVRFEAVPKTYQLIGMKLV